MDGESEGDRRCQGCRYWFERCCHVLALTEGDDGDPAGCRYFGTETASLYGVLRQDAP